MGMKRCPICGEKYSETYRDCPFCEEEEALREGEEIRRNVRGGKRMAKGRQFGLITPTLIVLILIMASLLIYLLRDGKDTEEDQTGIPPVEETTPGTEEQPSQEEQPGDTDPGQLPEDDQSGTMPEDGDEPVVPDTPDVPDESDTGASSEYGNANALPSGLSLSATDFTLDQQGETAEIRVSGGSGAYKWVSEDDGIASVDQSGKVTAISNGTVNVIVHDGSKKGVCIVRVKIPGGGTATPSDSGSPSGSASTSSGLKAGSATVVNGGNGVRVRSGPGTGYEILATVANGADIQVVRSAGDDWYEITFVNVGGVKTTGYMKGEFLENK